MTLAPETILQNRYKIVRQLGQGGMGTVYEARALRLNTTIALKETHFTDERLRRQFEREAQLLAGLRHPALPRVIDHFDEGDGLYLVMDFIAGDDLWGMLQKRDSGFPVDEVRAWAEQLLDALEYLHSQNPPVIHRDVKLQNLKLSDKGQLILLDFGLAKGLNSVTASALTTRTVLGFSLPYAPLEQILQIDESWREHLSVTHPEEVERLRRCGTDHRSDLYSAGATLLHLLTNKIPTNAPTRAISIWSGRPDPLEQALKQGIPDNFCRALTKAMALEPDQRFTLATEMRKALADIPQAPQPETETLPPTIIIPSSGKVQEVSASEDLPEKDDQGLLQQKSQTMAAATVMSPAAMSASPSKPTPSISTSQPVEDVESPARKPNRLPLMIAIIVPVLLVVVGLISDKLNSNPPQDANYSAAVPGADSNNILLFGEHFSREHFERNRNGYAQAAKDFGAEIGSGSEDLYLWALINNKLLKEKIVIDVDVNYGSVTLRGTVSSETQKNIAGNLAYATTGVKSVRNNLTVN